MLITNLNVSVYCDFLFKFQACWNSALNCHRTVIPVGLLFVCFWCILWFWDFIFWPLKKFGLESGLGDGARVSFRIGFGVREASFYTSQEQVSLLLACMYSLICGRQYFFSISLQIYFDLTYLPFLWQVLKHTQKVGLWSLSGSDPLAAVSQLASR